LPSWCRRCGSGCASPDPSRIVDLVFIVYLASHGARTPFLAILALRRPRVLLVVLGPALLLVAAARLLGPVLDPATAFGMVALASAPAAQALVPRVGLLGGRRDAAGAFAAGTVGLWLVLVATGAPGGSAALPGIQAFGLTAGVAAGFPRVRDALLGPIGWLGDGALLLLLGAALAGAPAVVPASVGAAALLLLLGALAAAGLARAVRRDPLSAVVGSGTRDAGVAIAMVVATAPAATGVPLAYAAVLALAAALAALRARRAFDRPPRLGPRSSG